MSNQKDKVYLFASLSDYSLKQQILIELADILFFASIKFTGLMTKIDVEGIENSEAIEAAGKIPIYTFWHDRIFLSTYFWRKRGIVVMTSKSFDGEYIARFIQRFGYGAIRGSSSRGGAKALVEMIKAMRNGLPMAFTLDGPRGPKYEVKSGPVILAKKTGNPIMPFVVEPMRFWTAKSWDKMHLPKPFTKALTIIGEPIYVAEDATDAEVEEKTAELQRSLDDLVSRGKAWREKNTEARA
ncbi:MAG: lysophospholipid acyltransferase family protein [Pyrinomonadaceae bacterium]